MKIKIYADGSNLDEMVDLSRTNRLVSGFTTNPSLMRRAGITNYMEFVRSATSQIHAPISFEVFADDLSGMEYQAKVLASFGDNVFVKIPITNTKGESTKELVKTLLNDHIKVNVTAVFTVEQVDDIVPYMCNNTQSILSIFAGRIADTGHDPRTIMRYATMKCYAITKCTMPHNISILWSSCREVYNIYEADKVGCHIITATPDIIRKLQLRDKDLHEYSLETVKMFYNDAKESGYSL